MAGEGHGIGVTSDADEWWSIPRRPPALWRIAQDAAVPEVGRHHALADVETRETPGSGIDEHRRAVGPFDDDRLTLADVKDRHAQVAVSGTDEFDEVGMVERRRRALERRVVEMPAR